MSNPRVLLRNVTLLGLAGVGVYFAYGQLRGLSRQDPFKELRRRESDALGERVGIRLEDVALRHYRNGTLTTQARVARLDVSRDRGKVLMAGITQGVHHGGKGKVMFEAMNGTLNPHRRITTLQGNVRAWNGDMDLRTENLTFNAQRGGINAPGLIAGKLYDGFVNANKMNYNTKTGGYNIGPLRYTGMVAIKPQDTGDDAPKRSKWDIEADSTEDPGTAAPIATYTKGVATDGEIILVAPKMERHKKTDVLVGTGGVHYYSGEANLIAEKATVYRKEKRVVLEGNVRMVVKPKAQRNDPPKVEPMPTFQPLAPDAPLVPSGPQGKEAEKILHTFENVRQYPLAITASRVEYFYAKGSRRATITGSPQARQGLAAGAWRYVWTDQALYDGERETLRLVSSGGKADTRMRNSIEDDVVAREVTLSTREDEDSYRALGIKGTLHNTDTDDDPRKKDEKPAPVTKPATPPEKAGEKKEGGPPPPTPAKEENKTGGV